MNTSIPPETLLAADPSMLLLALVVLVVLIFVGRFLFNLAWRLVALTTVVVVAFYLGTVVLPTILNTL